MSAYERNAVWRDWDCLLYADERVIVGRIGWDTDSSTPITLTWVDGVHGLAVVDDLA